MMKDKNILITGATSGIGRSAAIALSKMGANISFIARSPEKAQELQKEIKLASNLDADSIIADLSSLEQIRQAANEFKKKEKHIDVLLNNAGIMNTERKITVDGFEETFAVNHLAYFLLTNLLIDEILSGTDKRVVNVSSDAHKFINRINFEDLQWEESYKMFKAYGQSKLANILFTRKLSQLYENQGLTTNCLHPGFVSTSIGTQNKNRPFFASLIKLASPIFAKKSDKGAETSVYLCSSKEVENTSGEYFVDCKTAPTTPGAKNMEDADKLWEISKNLCNLN